MSYKAEISLSSSERKALDDIFRSGRGEKKEKKERHIVRQALSKQKAMLKNRLALILQLVSRIRDGSEDPGIVLDEFRESTESKIEEICQKLEKKGGKK